MIEADTLAEQTLMLASELPDRPLVLGGCCCSHVGAIEALSAGEECLAVVWIDAHGDLNTPATSPSGNTWGMPLRMVLDDGAVLAKHVALIGARNLDPPEVEFIEASGVQTGDGAVERALDGADAVYVAFDADVRRTGRAQPSSCPSRTGCTSTSSRRCCGTSAARNRIAGLGFTGLVRDPANEPKLARLATRSGLVTLTRRRPGLRSHDGRRQDRRLDRAQAGSRAAAEEAPEHLPELRLALPGRRAGREPAGVHPVRASLPGQGARADRRSSPIRAASSRRPATSARPIRSASSTSAPTTSGWPRRRSRPGWATRSSSAAPRSSGSRASSR